MKIYKGIKGKLDKLVGDYFRSKPCEYTHECKGRIEWAHIKSRRYLSTRWLEINCLSLCSKAHRYFTDHPDLFTWWLEKTYPDRLEELNKYFKPVYPIKEWQLKELYENLLKEMK